jgi:ATP-dependent DNA helicase RecG
MIRKAAKNYTMIGINIQQRKNMEQQYNEFIDKFNELRYHFENEVVEFKKAENNFDINDLGKYFSALSNEANLRNKDFAWLIFGVHDKTREVLGTSFKDGEVALNKLKNDMSQHTTENIIFRDIVPIYVNGKRVLMFKIPASPHNMVMKWKACESPIDTRLKSLHIFLPN